MSKALTDPSASHEVQALIKQLALIETDDPLAAVKAFFEADEGRAIAFLTQHGAEIEREAIKAELTGARNESKAHAFNSKVLTRLLTECESLDLAEAVGALKYTLRIIENADRVRLAKKDPYADLPVLHYTLNITPTGNTQMRATVESPEDSAGVIDVEARDSTPEPRSAAEIVNAVNAVLKDARPMPRPGGEGGPDGY